MEGLTVAEKFSTLPNGKFAEEVEQRWTGAQQLKDSVILQVEAGTISPFEGLGIISCITGQVFGYEYFHGHPSTGELLTRLMPSDILSRQ